jgi:molybdate transport system permease protein
MIHHRNAFWIASGAALFGYAILLAGILFATGSSASLEMISKALATREIQHSITTSLLTCTLATILAMWVAAPSAYLLSRCRFRGKVALELLLDLPIVMPPLVLGLGLLLLFQTMLGRWIENTLGLRFTYTVAGVVLAQFVVAAAFAIRSLRATFDEIPLRNEDVARTLGASDSQVFWRVVLPASRRGLLHATAVSWARSLGEFGPILVFAGTTRMKTEVMPTTIFLELNVGNLESAAAVSMLLLLAAAIILAILRWIDFREEAKS